MRDNFLKPPLLAGPRPDVNDSRRIVGNGLRQHTPFWVPPLPVAVFAGWGLWVLSSMKSCSVRCRCRSLLPIPSSWFLSSQHQTACSPRPLQTFCLRPFIVCFTPH
jgi:hypothetical protein